MLEYVTYYKFTSLKREKDKETQSFKYNEKQKLRRESVLDEVIEIQNYKEGVWFQ